MRILGVILIILGALAIAYKGITYEKTEQLAKVGPFEATAKKEETIPVPPWVGAVGIGAGALLLVAGSMGGRKR